jgi:hypothetical protein
MDLSPGVADVWRRRVHPVIIALHKGKQILTPAKHLLA